MNKYYYIYKIINLVNNKIYVGKHSTNDLNDGYMGSGSAIRKAEKELGIENFKKEIICYCESEEELNKKEAELVDEEFLKRKDVYNLTLGGDGSWDHIKGLVTVRDKNGNCFDVKQDDPRYLSGELIHVFKGLINVKDKNNKIFTVSVNDPKYLSGELVPLSKGMAVVKDKNGKMFRISKNDSKYMIGEFTGVTKGTVTVKDKFGNTFQVSVNDPRYLSKELVSVWTGKHHSEISKQKMKLSAKGKHVGKLNSNFGKMWIYNPELKQNKSIFKTEEIPYGWFKGRKMKF